MKILIAVDGSEFARRVLDFVATHRAMFGAEPDITLISVVLAVPPHAARYLDHSMLEKYYEDEAAEALTPARETLARAGLHARTLALHGHPATVIAGQADAGRYDLLLMGSHGHSPLGNAVLGSVVSGVLARCRTPLMVVR